MAEQIEKKVAEMRKGIIYDGGGVCEGMNPSPNRVPYFCLCQPLLI